MTSAEEERPPQVFKRDSICCLAEQTQLASPTCLERPCARLLFELCVRGPRTTSSHVTVWHGREAPLFRGRCLGLSKRRQGATCGK